MAEGHLGKQTGPGARNAQAAGELVVYLTHCDVHGFPDTVSSVWKGDVALRTVKPGDAVGSLAGGCFALTDSITAGAP